MDRAPDGDRVPLGPPSTTCTSTSSTSTCRRCRSAPPARSSSPGSASAAGTSTTPSAPGGLPGRSAPAGRAALPGRRLRPLAARTASWSSSAAGTPRSRSVVSGSRSARSRTPCCGCPVSATARWWSPSGPTRASTWWPSTPASSRSTSTSCGTGWPRRCPTYMVPSAFHWQESLPLTANSKIDKKALTALAAELAVADESYDAPSTPTEQRLAAAWAKVLGIAAGPDRPAGPLLRPGRHVPLGGEAGDHPGPGGVAQGRHPPPGPGRPGRTGRRQVRAGASGLLQLWRNRTAPPAGALVCFPYAGGNAVNFQPMASALRGSGLAVYAVELPGPRPGRGARAVRADRGRSSSRSSPRSPAAG